MIRPLEIRIVTASSMVIKSFFDQRIASNSRCELIGWDQIKFYDHAIDHLG